MQWYSQAFAKAFGGEIDESNGMTWTLHTSTYTPDRVAHAYVSSLTNELATGGGYTSGGIAAGLITRTVTAANSWGTSRANTTAYAVGDVVRPASANGFLYRCVIAGTSGGAPPTFSTVMGQVTTDGTVTWETYGTAIIVFTAASNPSWASASFTGVRYLVLSDRTTGVAATEPLIGITDFVTDQAGAGGTFLVNPHPTLGILHIPVQ
jgi:hypothetical protein